MKIIGNLGKIEFSKLLRETCLGIISSVAFFQETVRVAYKQLNLKQIKLVI